MPPAPQADNSWKVQVVEEEGQGQLELQICHDGENTSAFCGNMVLKIGGEALKLAVSGKQIQLSGSFMKATANRLTRFGPEGCIVLEGGVKLKYDKSGQKAEIAAEKVMIGVTDGHLSMAPVEETQRHVINFWELQNMGFSP
jgi:hypothetical protein